MAYPDLSNLNNNSNIGDLLAIPNASYPFFWSWILIGVGLLITLSLYFREKESNARGNLLSSAAVASLVVIVIATLGSIVNIVTFTALVPILVFGLLIIAIWFFS